MRAVRCSGRLPVRGEVSGQGCVCVCVSRGVCECIRSGVYTPPGTEFLTHAYENITFAQLLLRTVIIKQLNWVLVFLCGNSLILLLSCSER